LLQHEDRNSPVKKTFGIQKNLSYRRIIAEMGSGKGGAGL